MSPGNSHAYQIFNRWGSTATNGGTGPQGTPITLTWGFVADGTSIAGNEPASGSILVNFLDTQIGAGPGGADLTQRPWFVYFTESFSRIEELSGVTYVYEPNDTGDALNKTAAPFGHPGVRPDMRIGAHPVDGLLGSLAYAYFPDHGDLVLDTFDVSYYSNPSNNYRSFRNILMHESLHALGINHLISSTGRFLMEPIHSTVFDGPQLDDILALQRNYGDPLEKGLGNDTAATATPLGDLVHGTMLRRGTLGDVLLVQLTETDFVSIDGISDIDVYSFTLERTLDVALNLIPRGRSYNQGPEGGPQASFNSKNQSDLTLTLLGTDGETLLQQANDHGLGFNESISIQLTPGTYYARITGANDNVQLYGLDISGERVAADLIWTGQQSSAWDFAATANFSDSVGPVPYYDEDHVTFDDSTDVRAVTIAENVEPAGITVNTQEVYGLAGPGGIVAGSLALTGGGRLELANENNDYSGPTDVHQGTLVVVSATGTGDTTIYNGASLEGGGLVGGNLVVLEGATVRPGAHQALVTVDLEQDSSLTVDGDYTQNGGATLQIELGGLTDYTALVVSGTALLDGILDVHLGETFTASLGDRFDIVTAMGEVSGTFASTILPEPGSFLAFDVLYDIDTVSLAVVPALAGDFDIDGDVDGRDLLVWQRNPSVGNLADWQANYGALLNPLAAMSMAVPEPTSTVWVSVCCLYLTSGNRHTRRT